MATGDWIVRKLQELDQSVQDIRSTQLGHSSLQGEDSIRSYDADGNLSLVIGAQDDGTHAVQYVQGPPPLPPTPPLVTVDGPVVRVAWDGLLAGGDLPLDFARVDVHFAAEGEDLFDEDAVKANLNTTSGSEAVLMASETGTYRVALVARSQSRASSEPSEITEVEVSLVGLEGVIDSVVDNARGGKNHYTPTPPEGTDFDPDRDLWFDTSVDEEGFTHYTVHRWNQETGEWVSISDERMNAYAYLIPNFYEELDEVRESVDGKTTIRWSPNAPSPNTPGNTPGDTWFQYGDGRQKGHWRWDGNTWVKQDFDPVMIPQLDIGTGTFGELDGIRVKAGTITADVLGIGDFTNYVRDINRESAREFMARMGEHGQYSRVNRPDIAPGGSVAPWLWQQTTGTGFAARSLAEPLTVVPGEKILLSFQARRNGASTPIRLNLWVQDSQGNNVAWDLASPTASAPSSAPDGEWRTYTGTVTVPESGYRVVPQLKRNGNGDSQGGWYVTSIVVRRMVGSTLIENGAITTEHILAGAITAESAIISSIDLGVATVGYLHGSRVEAGTIDTPQLAFGAATGDILSVDALDFKSARGLTVRSGAFYAGDAVEITEDFGIRQFGPDGAMNVSLPSDGSPAEFRGDISARSFTASGRMSIQGPGSVASGGALELESGVVPPATPVGVSSYVERTTFPPVGENFDPVGLAWADGHWWRALDNLVTNAPDRIEKISPDGELVDFFEFVFIIHDGITIIGNEIFCLGRPEGFSKSRRWVRVFDMEGNQKRQWEYTQYGTGAFKPGIGTDGTNVLIAQCWANGRVTWRRFNPSTGALVGQVDSQDELNSNIQSVQVGRFDFSEDTAVITTGRGSGAVETYTSGGGFISAGGWYAGGQKQRVVATEWDGERWHHLNQDGNLVSMSSTKYPNGSPSTDTGDWWAAVTWTDGEHETPIGPTRQFTFMRRTDLRITTGQAPEGVTHARVYLARKATEPGRTDFHQIGDTSVNTEQSILALPSDWGSRPSPPASNSFASDTPGEIISELGTFRVDGTGAGEWGPLAFHADGSMTSNQVPEWVPITSFRPGFSPQTWGFVPAYRVWPDGKVEWRGVVNGTVNGNIPTLTIPEEAIPPYPVNVAVATSATSGAEATIRLEFGQLDTPNLLIAYRGAVERRWFGLDGVYYYLE